MAPATHNPERARALKGLEEAKAFLQGVTQNVEGDGLAILEKAGERIHQANCSFVMAILKDEECPAKLFKPWASVRRIRDWRDAGKFPGTLKNGKVCVKPSEFFKFFRTLKA